jgi:hypothetical protein
MIPEETKFKFGLSARTSDEHVMIERHKRIYGFAHAGRIAKERRLKQLDVRAYGRTGIDPAHPMSLQTREHISFTLLVDDFGTKCSGRDDAQHLMNTLELCGLARQASITLDTTLPLTE